MIDSISMSSEDLRIKDVPSIEDLEKIEAYNDEESREQEMVQDFVQTELLERFVDKDDRYDSSRRALGTNQFEYGDVKGNLSNFFGAVSGRVFRPEGRDMSDRDLKKIAGASTGESMHNKARNMYQSALENAGYELDDPSEDELIETAEQALDDIEREMFSVEAGDSMREAYGEAVRSIEEYRSS